MEQDRYQQNHTLFVIGLLALVASLSLFSFTFYVMPNLLFNWRYDVPDFVALFRERVIMTLHLSNTTASWSIFAILFFGAFIFGFVAYLASNQIDNAIYRDELSKKIPDKKPPRNKKKDFIFFKLLFMIILVFAVAAVVDQLLSS